MPSVQIIDDIILPSEMLRLNFQGKNPWAVCSLFPSLLKDVMKISGKDTFETDIRWDITSDPRPFYGVWMGKRAEDKWTNTFIRIIAQGEQSSREKTGWIRIQIKGTVETRYTYNNFIQKSWWWLYSYSFYYKQRRNYLDYAKDNVFKIRDRTLQTLGILPEQMEEERERGERPPE